MGSAIRVGRYILFGEIASGGMATVHFGRQFGSAGFARIVAIKRLHPHLAKDAEFSAMFLDEARIAARVRHPNVVPTIDVVALEEGELLLVMEYVLGETLSRLLRRVRESGDRVPPEIACGIVCDALHGLHAAHEAKSESGEALGIIHRDVSPHNVIVGGDGITRIVDFGVAKARGRIHSTRDGQVKGKLSYMAPEQLRGKSIDRRCDIFSAGVVMWEALTAQRLFGADSEGETVTRVLEAPLIAPSHVVETLPRALDAIVLRALARDPGKRFDTARDMASAIEAAISVANARAVSAWIHGAAGDVLAERAKQVADLEQRGDPDSITNAREEPPASQISSVSVSSDAVRGGRARKRTLVALLGVASVAAVAIAFAATHTTQKPSIATANVALQPAAQKTDDVASASPPTTASAIATSATSATTTATSASAPTSTTRHTRTQPTATASTISAAPMSSEHCPIKTFTGDDGIVHFRRDCSP